MITAPVWTVVDAVTGKVVAELPQLQVDTITETLSAYDTVDAVLHLSDIRLNEATITEPYAYALLLIEVDRAGNQVPTWGGFIKDRPNRDYQSESINLGLVTADGYLDRVYIDDEKITATGQLTALAGLIEKYALGGNGEIGIKGRVVVAGGAAGALRTQAILIEDVKTVMSLMTDWSGDENPLEWRTYWEPLAGGGYGVVFELGEENGVQVGGRQVTPSAAAVYSIPGTALNANLSEDWSDGHGANITQAISDGAVHGDARPPHSALRRRTGDRPALMNRFTAHATVSSGHVDRLDALADRVLNQIGYGTRSLTVTANDQRYPRTGIDWRLGDDVNYDVADSPAFRGGMVGSARPHGYSRDLNAGTIEVHFLGPDIDLWIPSDPDYADITVSLIGYSLVRGSDSYPWYFAAVRVSDQDPYLHDPVTIPGALQNWPNKIDPGADAFSIPLWAGTPGTIGAPTEGFVKFLNGDSLFFHDFGDVLSRHQPPNDACKTVHQVSRVDDFRLTDKSWRLYYAWYLTPEAIEGHAGPFYAPNVVGAVQVIFPESAFISKPMPLSINVGGQVAYLASGVHIWNSGSAGDRREFLPALPAGHLVDKNTFISDSYDSAAPAAQPGDPAPSPYPVPGFDPGPYRLWTISQLRALG